MTTSRESRSHDDPFRLVSIAEPGPAMAEVHAIWKSRLAPDHLRLLEAACTDVQELFAGRVSGYAACNTPYHTLEHTMLVFVAMARILDGAWRSDSLVEPTQLLAGLIAALYHDAGYIQDADDTRGTGAKHTVGHETRSCRQLERFLQATDAPAELCRLAADAIGDTEIDQNPPDPAEREGPSQLGTYLMYADLLGQMADRAYLEKLLLLFVEFREAGFRQYHSELDVLRGTPGFYWSLSASNSGALNDISELIRTHFGERIGAARDLYDEYIRRNLDYIGWIFANDPQKHRAHLRRNGIVARLAST